MKLEIANDNADTLIPLTRFIALVCDNLITNDSCRDTIQGYEQMILLAFARHVNQDTHELAAAIDVANMIGVLRL